MKLGFRAFRLFYTSVQNNVEFVVQMEGEVLRVIL